MIKTFVITLFMVSIFGCTERPVSCSDSKFKKLAQDAYLQTSMKKLTDKLIEKIGQYNEKDKSIAMQRFKDNTFLKQVEFENIKELSKDESINSAECEGILSFDTYDGKFSYKIKYSIQLDGRKTTLNMISQ